MPRSPFAEVHIPGHPSHHRHAWQGQGARQGHSGNEKIDPGAISPPEWSVSTLWFTPTAGYSLAGWFPQEPSLLYRPRAIWSRRSCLSSKIQRTASVPISNCLNQGVHPERLCPFLCPRSFKIGHNLECADPKGHGGGKRETEQTIGAYGNR